MPDFLKKMKGRTDRSRGDDRREYATGWRQAVPRANGLRERTRAAARHAFLSFLGRVSRGSEDRFLRCLYGHCVFDDQREDFERILEELLGLGTFVDTETCVEMVQGERPIDGRYFHLSFDDGFKNIATNAAPVLRRLGIPAIAFVPSSLIGADWETAEEYCLRIDYRDVIELADWDDLAFMVESGVEVGSHTRTHARFSELSADPERARDEIAGSKAVLEDGLGLECRYISWPYGQVGDADEASLRAVREAGYRACFGAFRGRIIPGETDRFRIPRHLIEVQWPRSHIGYFARGGMERQS